MINIATKRIRRSFSYAASNYDNLTSIHREIGCELLQKLNPLSEHLNILDVGMGTGWLTDNIRRMFPNSLIVGIDSAEGMIKFSKSKNRNYNLVQADASTLPFRNNSFNLIVSNLAYQWVENLNESFKKCFLMLKNNGSLYVSMFGRNTFNELFNSIENCIERRDKSSEFVISRLLNKEQVANAIKQIGVDFFNVYREHKRVIFPDFKTLIKWISGIGANNLEKNFYMGRNLLAATEDHYKRHFCASDGIYATLEVIWLEVKK